MDARFVPLPIGLPHHCDGLHRGNLRAASEAESLIQQCRAKATPWNLRSQRLLVTPMQANRLRERYLERLSSPEFGALVRVVTTRLVFAGFLALMAEHQTVLSPPDVDPPGQLDVAGLAPSRRATFSYIPQFSKQIIDQQAADVTASMLS